MRLLPATFIAALSAAFASGVTAQSSIESPRFEVVIESDGAQIRDYAPMIVAEVTVEARNAGQASSRGFRPLANYIFGGNTARDKIAMTSPVTAQPKSQKIDMTSPVTSQATGKGEYTVRFIMPTEWTMEALPIPNDSRIKLVEVPRHQMAAVRWIGGDNEEIRTNAEAYLKDWTIEHGYTISGPATWAGYDGPMTPRSQRRYEIMLPVTKAEDAA